MDILSKFRALGWCVGVAALAAAIAADMAVAIADAADAEFFAVSSRGAWGEWLDFFLRAVHDQANDAVERAIALLQLRDEYRRRITVARQSLLLLAIIDRLFQSPAVTITGLARDVGASYPAAKQNVEKLVAAGILEPLSDTRNKVYMAREILALIE